MTLFGYGNTNKAIAKRFKNCVIFDDKFKESSADEWGNRLLPSHLFDPDSSELEIVTPGIPPSHPLVKSAKNLQSDYDFFADDFPFSIWISGTNGKTTTTEMTTLLLSKYGAVSGGNIGTAVADLDANAKIWVLETSSFTLHYTNRAKPNIYLLLPIKDDHASWHGSFAEYEKAKLKPLAQMREGEAIILPKKYENIESKGFKICYESGEDLANYFGIDRKKIIHKEPFLFDSLFALATTKILFDELDYELLNSYRIGEHRVEEFVDTRGRIWVDDSKGTNIDATIEALKRYREKQIFLILGGDDKGANLGALFEFMKDLDICVYAIGKNAEKIKENCITKAIFCEVVCELERAVFEIAKTHKKGSVALMSPAAASLDQFSSYKERGEKFKAFVKNLS